MDIQVVLLVAVAVAKELLSFGGSGGGAGAIVEFEMTNSDLKSLGVLGTNQLYTVNEGASSLVDIETIFQFSQVYIKTSAGWQLCNNVWVKGGDTGWVGVGNSVFIQSKDDFYHEIKVPYWYYTKAFSDEECDKIIESGLRQIEMTQEESKAKVQTDDSKDGKVDIPIRDCQITWLDDTWLYQRVENLTMPTKKGWGWTIHSMEKLQKCYNLNEHYLGMSMVHLTYSMYRIQQIKLL